ncbi:hypothetical protein BASA81_003680 [Batrachochytrium salamandrivorans]|nr:hypothetical protein BASA81_003680 [Batrachochytrium salamandrivorans]
MVDLAKWLVSGVVAGLVVYYRNGYWFWVVTGALANAVLVKVLKRIINLPRPAAAAATTTTTAEKLDPGMPSSHAHMLSYFTTLAFCAGKANVGCGLAALAIAVCCERVHRGVHTPNQCAVGLVTGCLGALVWASSLAALHHRFEEVEPSLALLVMLFVVGVGLLTKVGRRISG